MYAKRIEVEVFIDIIFRLRLLADALQQHVRQVEKTQATLRAWPDEDLTGLYEAWLEVGRAIGSVTRTQPDAAAAQPRKQVLEIRDGLKRIADIVERQV